MTEEATPRQQGLKCLPNGRIMPEPSLHGLILKRPSPDIYEKRKTLSLNLLRRSQNLQPSSTRAGENLGTQPSRPAQCP